VTRGNDEPAILPQAVREYEIEDAPLFHHFLLFVETGSFLREFQKANAFL
jgi:hypothetical protein